jgi:hypothetical protein
MTYGTARSHPSGSTRWSSMSTATSPLCQPGAPPRLSDTIGTSTPTCGAKTAGDACTPASGRCLAVHIECSNVDNTRGRNGEDAARARAALSCFGLRVPGARNVLHGGSARRRSAVRVSGRGLSPSRTRRAEEVPRAHPAGRRSPSSTAWGLATSRSCYHPGGAHGTTLVEEPPYGDRTRALILEWIESRAGRAAWTRHIEWGRTAGDDLTHERLDGDARTGRHELNSRSAGDRVRTSSCGLDSGHPRSGDKHPAAPSGGAWSPTRHGTAGRGSSAARSQTERCVPVIGRKYPNASLRAHRGNR